MINFDYWVRIWFWYTWLIFFYFLGMHMIDFLIFNFMKLIFNFCGHEIDFCFFFNCMILIFFKYIFFLVVWDWFLVLNCMWINLDLFLHVIIFNFYFIFYCVIYILIISAFFLYFLCEIMWAWRQLKGIF